MTNEKRLKEIKNKSHGLVINPDVKMELIKYHKINGNVLARLLQPDTHWRTVREVWSAMEGGLSEEQILFFLRPGFIFTQMRQARLGFQNGLSMEKVASYYKKSFYYKCGLYLRNILSDDMEQARIGLEEGLSDEEVLSYFQSKYNHKEMAALRQKSVAAKVA